MNKYQLTIPLPSQGLNLLDDSLIHDSEVAEGTVNISFKDGTPQTRKGYIKETAFPQLGEDYPLTKLFVHQVDSYPKLLYVRHDAVTPAIDLYQLNDAGPKRHLGALASTKPTFQQVSCALTGGHSYSEKVLVADGTKLRWFDAAKSLTQMDSGPYGPTLEEIDARGTNVLITTPDEVNKQRFIAADDNRIWLAGYQNLVRISHLGLAGAMPDYWPSTQVVKMPEEVTGLCRFMGEMMIFTENTTSLVSGNTPVYGLDGAYKNVQLPGGYGCSSHETIALGDNAVYWANRLGVYRYIYLPSGDSLPQCVSEFLTSDGHTRTIRKRIEAITDWDKVFGVFFQHEYRLYLGDGEVLVFDTINSSWALYQYYNQFGGAVAYGYKLYCSGYTSDGAETPKHWVYDVDYPWDPEGASLDGLSDDNDPADPMSEKAIHAVLKSKFFDFSKAANKKRFVKLYFTLYSELTSYDIDVTINVDNEYTTMTSVINNKASRWGNDNPDDDAEEIDYALAFGDVINANRTNLNYPVRIRHRGKKYNIQYEMSSSGLNHAWLLKAVVLLLKIKELK